MKLKTILYSDYEKDLPQNDNWILGQADENSLIVYQAFNPHIANYASAQQKFGGSAYSFNRMTWIKPNFLWMMYRAGWATKVNQERILALQISKTGFFELLKEGVYSSFQADKYESHEAWKQALAESRVRIQWDPDHDPQGAKLERRAIQIGFKGDLLHTFNEEYLEAVTDITDFVKAQQLNLGTDALMVMQETAIEVPEELRLKYSCNS